MANKGITREALSNLSTACRYWTLATRSGNSKTAAEYYAKAYATFLRELGADHPMTVELRMKMNGRVPTAKPRRMDTIKGVTANLAYIALYLFIAASWLWKTGF